jgi:hypothetical protein
MGNELPILPDCEEGDAIDRAFRYVESAWGKPHPADTGKGSNMAWFILAAVYLVIGLGVFAWGVRGRETTRKRSAKTLALFPELCLFWPLALIVRIKRRKFRRVGP